MAYVDNLVILTTHIKNEQKGAVDDFRDAEIIEWLRPRLNKAAQLGNTTITFDISDLTSHLSNFKEAHLSHQDFREVDYALEHAIDQLNDGNTNSLKLRHYMGLWYIIEWNDKCEF